MGMRRFRLAIAGASGPNKAAPMIQRDRSRHGAAWRGISDAVDATPIKPSFVDCRLSVAIVEPLAPEIESCCGRR